MIKAPLQTSPLMRNVSWELEESESPPELSSNRIIVFLNVGGRVIVSVPLQSPANRIYDLNQIWRENSILILAQKMISMTAQYTNQS